MNRTQRLHIIKRVLKEEFEAIELERVNTSADILSRKDQFVKYRLRNGRRVDWAEKIEKALQGSEK